MNGVSERVAIFDSLMNRIIEADERVPPGYLTSLNYFRFSAANVDEGSGILFFFFFGFRLDGETLFNGGRFFRKG